ncbi:protein of unknown function UPF0233 [Segniliparus rotundus DSM 44985]|uniref:Cell division protein CrgA n=1 Tax=Segniliparus rotundus (strain ATCC BAA-972 / CDC 1076 / CIP 108378 / DSM 44985 / JCM 13578) TaxID=640132 RepID=D6ZB54_SEGRD|nr:cell division protein CrgA [Segniliparus rotundus]ADG96813.1 protein of unknown function UPF0233 [Segniliparus rotundus DSM 44985]
MPKSKVRKKTDFTINPGAAGAGSARTAPSSTWYVALMLGFMLAGLAWLVVYYIAAADLDALKWMADLQFWNLAIGFGLMVVGLLMTMRWH